MLDGYILPASISLGLIFIAILFFYNPSGVTKKSEKVIKRLRVKCEYLGKLTQEEVSKVI